MWDKLAAKLAMPAGSCIGEFIKLQDWLGTFSRLKQSKLLRLSQLGWMDAGYMD
jgi:hypothetical protein